MECLSWDARYCSNSLSGLVSISRWWSTRCPIHMSARTLEPRMSASASHPPPPRNPSPVPTEGATKEMQHLASGALIHHCAASAATAALKKRPRRLQIRTYLGDTSESSASQNKLRKTGSHQLPFSEAAGGHLGAGANARCARLSQWFTAAESLESKRAMLGQPATLAGSLVCTTRGWSVPKWHLGGSGLLLIVRLSPRNGGASGRLTKRF